MFYHNIKYNFCLRYRYTDVVNDTASVIAALNPFRYRSYYFDTETNLYYLNTRYYDPIVGRFINVDDISYLAPDTINGLNLYAYCGNNPVMRADPNGTEWWNPFTWDWGSILDVAITVIGGLLGAVVGSLVGMPLIGAAIGIGVINNAVNAIYYNSLPEISTNEIKAYEDSQKDLPYNEKKSYYVDNGYINRWDRLKYVKAATNESHYNLSAWTYYSEYNLHMYGWLLFGNFKDGNNIFSTIAEASKHTNIGNNNTILNIATYIIGVFGI